MGEAPGQSQPAAKTGREEPKLPLFGTHDTSLPMNDRDRKSKFRRGGGKTAAEAPDSGRHPPWPGTEPDPDGPANLHGCATVPAALVNLPLGNDRGPQTRTH